MVDPRAGPPRVAAAPRGFSGSETPIAAMTMGEKDSGILRPLWVGCYAGSTEAIDTIER